MNPSALLFAALAVLPALGLAFWSCCVMDQVVDEMDARIGWTRVPPEGRTAPDDARKGKTGADNG